MSWFSGQQGGGGGQQPPPPPHRNIGQPQPQPQYSSLPTQPRPQPSARRPAPQYDQQAPPGNYEKYQQRGPPAPPRGGTGRAGRYTVVEAPSTGHALTNCLIVNEGDWGKTPYVTVRGEYGSFVFTTKTDPQVQPGTIGAARLVRQWAGLSQSGHVVDVEAFDPQSVGTDVYLASLDLEVAFWTESKATSEPFNADQMSQVFLRAYEGLIFSPGQLLVFDFHGQTLKANVKGLHNLSLSSSPGAPQGGGRHGILTAQSEVNFLKDPSSAIKIKSSAKKAPPNAILAPNFKFEDMGIGGLDDEFSAIFRRAFASRIFPPGLVEKLGIQHVKGILLFGPPGTGKTLMARQIGKMLNAREPKVVNGPEILNKFVGQSEENIRKLFGDAEKEYKEKGDESGLHIIIFDELDAICKQRGSTNNGTGVGDSVVNQLLSKMDGVDQLNNILIIGMTNRLDMIDEALLRPGRLEVHIEISLPDEKGRVQILNIQTNKMRTNGVMGQDVDLVELASLTKNFSGAEIGGLVKSATSFAFNRHVKVGTMAGISDDIDKMQVVRADFMNALDEVQPAFGVNEEELQAVVQNGIIHYADHIHSILKDGKLFVEQVRQSQRTPLVSLLIHGLPGAGKTALAATIAMASQFPFIKLISAENMVGYSEASKITYLNKVFSDSYKSPLSVIVVDGIERILDWVPIGPRFSNGVLQALMVLLSKRPPKGRRLFVIATTSNRSMLTDMDVMDAFSADIRVPPLDSLQQLDKVLRDVDLFRSPQDLQRTMQLLQQAGFGQEGKLNIGIKKLLSLIEMCRQDPEGASDKLVSSIIELGLPAITLDEWLNQHPVQVYYASSRMVIGALPYYPTLRFSDVYHVIHALIPRDETTTVTLTESNGVKGIRIITAETSETVGTGFQRFEIEDRVSFDMPGALTDWADDPLPSICEDSTNEISSHGSRMDIPSQFSHLFSQQQQQPLCATTSSRQGRGKDVLQTRSPDYLDRCRLRDGKCLLTGTCPFPDNTKKSGMNFGVLQAAHIFPRKYADQFSASVTDNGSVVLNPQEELPSPSHTFSAAARHYRKVLGGWAGIDSLQNLMLLRADLHAYYDNLAWIRVPDGRVVWLVPIHNPPELLPLVHQDGCPRMYQFHVSLFSYQRCQAVAQQFMVPNLPLALKAAASPPDLHLHRDPHFPVAGMSLSERGTSSKGEELSGEEERENYLMLLADGLEGMSGDSRTLRESGEVGFGEAQIRRQMALLEVASIPEERKRFFLEGLRRELPSLVK